MKKTLSTLIGASALAVSALAFAPTQAQALSCSSGGFSSSFSFTGSAPEPDFCIPTTGNLNPAGTETFLNTNASTSAYAPWDWLAKADAPNTTPNEGDSGLFQLTYDGDPDDSKSGTLKFLKTVSAPFAVTLKFGQGLHFYVWNPVETISANSVYKWTTSKGLSHVDAVQGVPEPITLLGSGIALGFGMYAKRKLNGQKTKI